MAGAPVSGAEHARARWVAALLDQNDWVGSERSNCEDYECSQSVTGPSKRFRGAFAKALDYMTRLTTTPMTAQPQDSAVTRSLDRACGGRAIPGNRVVHLQDGPEAFAAMLEILDGARFRINFENYIIRDDDVGRRFADHLTDAASRGVDVHVLYDHLGSRGTSRSYWKRLRQAGVTVLPFNRINLLHPLRSIQRDHCKFVSADGSRAVVGGLCIGDEWAGRPDEGGPRPWRDTAVLVEGPVVPALGNGFSRRWVQAGGVPLDGSLANANEPKGAASIRPIDGVPGKLRLFQAIQLLAAGAAHRLWITDAYLVAPSPFYAALVSAARDAVDVRLLLPGRTDIPAVRALTRVGYRELLEAGVRIWEWHGPMLHAKTVLTDDIWFKVGSSNINPSSLLSNYELDLLVEDVELATAASHQFRRDLGNAVEIVLRARRVPQPLASRLPKAVVPAERPPTERAPGARGELGKRAAVTLSQVAGAARRSIGGAIAFAAVGVGVLFIALPRVMAYLLAAMAFWLAVVAVWEGMRRRAYRGD